MKHIILTVIAIVVTVFIFVSCDADDISDNTVNNSDNTDSGVIAEPPYSPDEKAGESVRGEEYGYTVLDDGTVSIREYFGKSVDIIYVPDEIDGRKVTSVGAWDDSGVFGNINVTEIILPDSIIRIGKYAFSGCRMESIHLGEYINQIGSNAFYNCASLISLSIPKSVELIGDYAFSGCTKLKNIELPYGIKTLPKYVFRDCTALTSLTIPDSVEIIEEYAFSKCSSLVNVQLPKALKILPVRLFEYCTALTSLIIPDSVEIIEEGAFSNCVSLNDVQLPKALKILPVCIFEYCASLTSLTIPDSVEIIEEGAFSNCVSLMDVQLPKTLKILPMRIFTYCTSLTSVIIPEGVEEIHEYAFGYCSSLQQLEIPESVKQIDNSFIYRCDALQFIKYTGSVEEWQNIQISNNTYNYYTIDTSVLYNADSFEFPDDPLIMNPDIISDREQIIASDIKAVERTEAGLGMNAEARWAALYYSSMMRTLDRIIFVKSVKVTNIWEDSDVEFYCSYYDVGLRHAPLTYRIAVFSSRRTVGNFCEYTLSGLKIVDDKFYLTDEEIYDFISLDSRYSGALLPKTDVIEMFRLPYNITHINLSEQLTQNITYIDLYERISEEMYKLQCELKMSIDYRLISSNYGDNGRINYFIDVDYIYNSETVPEYKYYVVEYDIKTGEIIPPRMVSVDEYYDMMGYHSEPTIPYENDSIRVYKDEKEDLYIYYKNTKKTLMLFDAFTDYDYYDLIHSPDYDNTNDRAESDLSRYNGVKDIDIYKDRYILFNTVGWEWINNSYIYDIDTQKFYTVDTGKYLHRIIGNRAYYYTNAGDDYTFGMSYCYIDLASGELDKIIPLEYINSALDDVSSSGKVNYDNNYISDNGEYFIFSSNPNNSEGVIDAETEIINVINIITGEFDKYEIKPNYINANYSRYNRFYITDYNELIIFIKINEEDKYHILKIDLS